MGIADKRVPLLFLISDTGGGHRSAAQAVGEALERQYPGKFEPVIADPLTGPGTPPGMRWFVSLYAPLIRLTPWLWHVSWRFSNRKWGLSIMYKTAFAPARTTVTRAIDACRPAAVVAFHGMVTRPAVLARQRALPAVPVLTVITDLVTAHRAWRETRVDQIAVPSPAVGRSCQADGYPPGRCTDTGLPVSVAFTAPPATEAERLALRASLGAHPDRFLVVLTGGAAGAGRLGPKAMALVRAFGDVTVVVVCGRNEQLRRRLTLESWRYSGRLLPLGFVTNMADWLRCADAVVTKAGPGTIAETLCCGTPLLLTSYLSGQEKGNAEFVVSAGAGRWVPQLPQLLDTVGELRDDPVLLGQMRVNAASVGRPDAAAAVARLIADMAAPRLGSFLPTAEMARNHVPFRTRIRKRTAGSRLREPVLQPDLSRCGGITEAMRIAALASAAGLPVCTHGCHTGLNMAASVHFLASIDCARYFEGDGSTDNPLRWQLCSASYELAADGTVRPLEGAGLGVEIDEGFLRAHPITEGPAWT